MILQTLVVALLVSACASYATWTLMPTSLRRSLAGALLKLPLPRAISATMAKQAAASSSCACDGCDKGKAPVDASTAAKPSGPAIAPIVFHPRLRK